MTSASTTSIIEASMYMERSRLISSLVPAGRSGITRSRSARTARATASVLALEICSMPMLMPGTPLVREIERSFSAARRTSATSPSRTR